MDIAHWEFIGLLFGLALALVEMSGWKMRYLRHGIGIVGVLLAVGCVVLLFGFSGATLRSPVSFRWPVVLPSEKPSASAPIPIVRSQLSQTPYLAEFATLKDENAKLKTENARLKKLKASHVIAALPMPSACPSVTPILYQSKLTADNCDGLIQVAKAVGSADRDRVQALTNMRGAKTTEELQGFLIQGLTAKVTEDQADANLEKVKSVLCAERLASPTPTGR